MSTIEYTELPARAQDAMKNFMPKDSTIDERVKKYRNIPHREMNKAGDVEVLDGVDFVHHFIDVPGDYDTVTFHYVTAGMDKTGEFVVFLHGIPDSWFQWHHQMAYLAKKNYRTIAIDLKGYGQSEKKAGDYRHEGAALQLYGVLVALGIDKQKFNLVAHDRGVCQADYIAAFQPEAVLHYGRGEQHLYHYNPVLSPQGEIFANAPRNGIMDDPARMVVWGYTELAHRTIPDEEHVRVIQEFSFPGISSAVPRYFNSSTFRSEWLNRRNRLLAMWKCPVLIMQGHESRTQPREFYENAKDYLPNAKDVKVTYLPGGHFWTLECPDETTNAVEQLLEMSL